MLAVCAVLAVGGLLLFAWPVDGVWFGLVWLVYPAGYWPAAPPAVRIAAWVLLGNLYPMLVGTVLAAVHRAAPPSRPGLTRRLSPVNPA